MRVTTLHFDRGRPEAFRVGVGLRESLGWVNGSGPSRDWKPFHCHTDPFKPQGRDSVPPARELNT